MSKQLLDNFNDNKEYAPSTFNRVAFNMLSASTNTPSETKDIRVLREVKKTEITGFDKSRWDCR